MARRGFGPRARARSGATCGCRGHGRDPRRGSRLSSLVCWENTWALTARGMSGAMPQPSGRTGMSHFHSRGAAEGQLCQPGRARQRPKSGEAASGPPSPAQLSSGQPSPAQFSSAQASPVQLSPAQLGPAWPSPAGFPRGPRRCQSPEGAWPRPCFAEKTKRSFSSSNVLVVLQPPLSIVCILVDRSKQV